MEIRGRQSTLKALACFLLILASVSGEHLYGLDMRDILRAHLFTPMWSGEGLGSLLSELNRPFIYTMKSDYKLLFYGLSHLHDDTPLKHFRL